MQPCQEKMWDLKLGIAVPHSDGFPSMRAEISPPTNFKV